LEGEGWLSPRKIGYLLHDRDTKFCASFRETLSAGGVKCLRLPARSPNLNSYAERWVRTVKEECLSKLILFGEGSLRRALREFEAHYHGERNHQGKGNVLLFPCGEAPKTKRGPSIRCHERLGGLLKYYHRRPHEFFDYTRSGEYSTGVEGERKMSLREGLNLARSLGTLWAFYSRKTRVNQTHFRTTISVPYGSKSAFERHSCLLVSVD
jgi:transposase InsO family protein